MATSSDRVRKPIRADRLLVGIVLLTCVFIGELIMPFLGFEALLYCIVTLYVLTTDQSPQFRRDSLLIGVLATAFISLGAYFRPSETGTGAAYANHLLGIIAVWTIVFFSIRYKHITQEESKQKEQLQALFNNATEGILFVSRAGRIIRINSRAAAMFGYEPGALIGSSVGILIPDRLSQIHAQHVEKFFAHPFSKTMTSRPGLIGRKKDGTEFPLDLSLNYFKSGTDTVAIVFLVDSTERKRQEAIITDNLAKIKRLNENLESQVNQRTEELTKTLAQLEAINADLHKQIAMRQESEVALRKTQRLYEVMAHNFPDGMIGVFDKLLNCVFLDGREAATLGITHTVAADGRVHVHLPDSFRSPLEPYLRKSLHGETTAFEVFFDSKYYHVSAVPIQDSEQDVQELMVVIRNITGRKNMERNLLQSLEKEKELNVLKSRFVTMASHEFRTPLSTISTSLFLLENYTGADYEEEKRKHIDRIKRSVRHLTEVLNDFLNLGKLEEGKVKVSYCDVHLHDLMGELLEELEAIKKPGQQINLSIPNKQDTVYTDPTLLKGVLTNLLSNAIKYSGPDENIDLDILTEQGTMRILVADHGIGIPDDEKRHIFKRFYRAVNATYIPGTGLGLNIIKKYLRLLNGSIEFESELNKGTTFIVNIPLEPQGKPQAVKQILKPTNQMTHE